MIPRELSAAARAKYAPLPAYLLGEKIRPFPTLNVGDARKVRVYVDGAYVCASYERARTMTAAEGGSFCARAVAS